VAIEATATPAIQAIVLAQQAIKKRDTKTVAANIHIIANTLHHICDLLDRMTECCDHIFIISASVLMFMAGKAIKFIRKD